MPSSCLPLILCKFVRLLSKDDLNHTVVKTTGIATGAWAQPLSDVQILQFYEKQGLKLPQQPPLLMVKSAELGNAASREQHPSSDRSTPGGTAAGPVLHTRYPSGPLPTCLHPYYLARRER